MIRITNSNKQMISSVVLAVSLAGFLTPARAQLRDKLPVESILFVEFTGTDHTRQASLTTPFGKLMNDPGMKAFSGAVWDALTKQIVEEATQNGEAELAANLTDLVSHLWQKGFALSLSGFEMTPQGPDLALAVVTPAGAKEAEIPSKIEMLIQHSDLPPAAEVDVDGLRLKRFNLPVPMPIPCHYGIVGDTFVFTVGTRAPSMVIAAVTGSASNLTVNESLQKAFEHIGAKGRTTVASLHADVKSVLTQVDALFKGMGQEGLPPHVKQIVDGMGISDCRSVTYASQITDGGYRTSAFVATAPQRTGLLKIVDQQPLTDGDLAWIPQDATWAYVINLDVAKAYDQLMSTVKSNPFVGGAAQSVIAQFESASGLRLREDIFAAFKDSYFLFDGPSNGGFFFTGMVLGVEVADPETVGQLVERAAKAILKHVEQDAGDDFRFRLATPDHGKYKLHCVEFPRMPIPLIPTWCIVEDRLVVGAMPQSVMSTVDRIVAGKGNATSILANKDYQRGRRFLPRGITSVQYNDTRQGVSGMYKLVVLGAQALGNMSEELDVEIDASRFPTYRAFSDGMYGDVIGTWVDDAGYHQAGHGPWPLPVPTFGAGGGAGAAMMLSIALPSLSRARQLAKRTVSMANLRGIGMACHVYAANHDGVFPPGFQTLIDDSSIDEKMLYAPNGDGSVWSYKYIQGHSNNSKSHWVVAYESYPGQPEEGANILFLDGHVEFIKPLSAVASLVEKTKQAMDAAKPQ